MQYFLKPLNWLSRFLFLLLAINIVNIRVVNAGMYFNSSNYNNNTGVTNSNLPVFEPDTKIVFSKKSGFYKNNFTLTLSTNEPGATIVYTLDGSNPQNSATAIAAGNIVNITIDPLLSIGRDATPAVMVRASLVASGFAPSFAVANTYIFIDKVLTQKYPGGNWPSGKVNSQVIDLDMDPDIVNDSRYSSQIEAALLDIPTISVCTGIDNLFDAKTGIYVNARQHGAEWERECSVELIDTKTGNGFQINAGLRIRGGNSRQGANPKHAFRLFFRKEYGAAKLEFPLFGNQGATEFDKIDLRTEQNYSWSMDGDSHNTFLRDIFARDLQGEMGQPYTRGNYYHLYLNGMYWGLYQTEERPEANFAATYLGGNSSDYDVVKVDTENWPYVNETTDGNIDAWEKLYEICKKNTFTLADYFGLEAKDANGKPVAGQKKLVDIDNLIDYLLTIFYTGNIDAPVSAWYYNSMPNNYYALYNNKFGSRGFVFVGHDSEHSMFVDPIYVNDGLYENRVTIDDPPMDEPDLVFFHPQWLHHKLCTVDEYRTRFADRASFYFSNNQALSPQKCSQRWLNRKKQIELAIIGESARWGDAKSNTPLNKDDHWLPECDYIVDEFFPYRSKIVVNQLIDAKLYSTIDAPVFLINDTVITNKQIIFEPGLKLSITNSNDGGQIYYTLNGSDPRLTGGQINHAAVQIANNQTININGTTVVNARVKNNNQWGALRQLSVLNKSENFAALKLTEINYHPVDIIAGTDTIDGKDLEFIELKNTGATAINLSGVTIDSAVYFKVPDGTVLLPGGFYVVASKPNQFFSKYGLNANANFKGNLANSGEYILITSANGNKLIECYYDDNYPWPVLADGLGYSLSAVNNNPDGNPGNHEYWKASSVIDGTPFADDTPLDVNSVYANTDVFMYPNPAKGIVNIQFNAPNIVNNACLKVYNITGQMVISTQLTGQTACVNIGNYGLPDGIYSFLVTVGNSRYVKKIIIAH